MFEPLRVTFALDGTGVYYDPYEPPHIDALLTWVNAPFTTNTRCLGRDDAPDDISLPLAMWHMRGVSGFHASALFPDGVTVESLLMWRKKFRQGYIDRVESGTPNLQNGPYREYNTPLPLLLCHTLVGYCVGDRRRVRSALKRIRFIGKKRSYGRGMVLGMEVERIDDDHSLVKDDIAMRWLPLDGAPRLVRTRPPYWNNSGRVACCEIGDPYTLHSDGGRS